MIRAYLHLLASAAVALREGGDDIVRRLDVDLREVAEGLHTQELAASEFRTLAKQPEVPSGVGRFGTSKAFVQLLTMKVPEIHLEAFKNHSKTTFATQKENEPGLIFSQALANEHEPNLITIAQVFNDSDAYIKHSKSESLENWYRLVKEIGADLFRADVLGDPGNATEAIQALEIPRQIWPQFTGFARAPRSDKSEDDAWLLEYKFTVPDENLTRFHVLDAANVAAFFDWDKFTFFHRTCEDDEDDTDDVVVFNAIEGYTSLPGFKKLAGTQSAAYWSEKAAEFGMKVEAFNVYGASPKEARELMKFLGNATFWEPISGFARY